MRRRRRLDLGELLSRPRGVLGGAESGRDAVRAVAALVGADYEELAAVLDEAVRDRSEEFILSLVWLAAALALSTPDDFRVPGSLSWWALRHEVALGRDGS